MTRPFQMHNIQSSYITSDFDDRRSRSTSLFIIIPCKTPCYNRNYSNFSINILFYVGLLFLLACHSVYSCLFAWRLSAERHYFLASCLSCNVFFKSTSNIAKSLSFPQKDANLLVLVPFFSYISKSLSDNIEIRRL